MGGKGTEQQKKKGSKQTNKGSRGKEEATHNQCLCLLHISCNETQI